jgi:hypothetical protein
VRGGWFDFAGLGRAMLSYPEMPDDILAGRELSKRRICRTFSDCTTAPRYGLVSGCYPLDEFYSSRPEAELVKKVKQPHAPGTSQGGGLPRGNTHEHE